jgi:hypothetical protein
MIVYIQRKVDDKWYTILPVDEERVHRVCLRLMIGDSAIGFRVVKDKEAG